MEHSLARSAIEGLGDFQLEDPRSFEALTIRMAEDMEVAMQAASIAVAARAIDGEAARRTLDLLGISTQGAVPTRFLAQVEVVARDNVRGPLEFSEDGLRTLSMSVSQAAFHLVSTGAQRAAEQHTQIVSREFVMMACSDLPYPLNRLCSKMEERRRAGQAAESAEKRLTT